MKFWDSLNLEQRMLVIKNLACSVCILVLTFLTLFICEQIVLKVNM